MNPQGPSSIRLSCNFESFSFKNAIVLGPDNSDIRSRELDKEFDLLGRISNLFRHKFLQYNSWLSFNMDLGCASSSALVCIECVQPFVCYLGLIDFENVSDAFRRSSSLSGILSNELEMISANDTRTIFTPLDRCFWIANYNDKQNCLPSLICKSVGPDRISTSISFIVTAEKVNFFPHLNPYFPTMSYVAFLI